ncbi:MAG: hypothetical protein DRP78_04890 [Candidatus Omnitrophota bacterium]|nr:MAG: hypothetical protein DRP78_04890 [Candidatus Omnitrophota bacterium]
MKLRKEERGSLLAKFLSLFVSSTFIMSNLCFALPAANFAPNAVSVNPALQNSVDNLALPAGTTKILEQKEGFALLLKAKLGAAYDQPEVQRIMDMWTDNIAGTGRDDLIAEIQKLIASAGITVTGNNISMDDEVIAQIQDGKFALTKSGDAAVETLAKLVGTNEANVGKYMETVDGKEQSNPTKLAALANALRLSAEKSTPKQIAKNAEAINYWEQQVNANLSQDAAAQAREQALIEDVRELNDAGNLVFGSAQVKGAVQYSVANMIIGAKATPSQMTLPLQFKEESIENLANLIAHEAGEALLPNMDHSQRIEQQEGIFGKKTNEDLRTALLGVINDGLAANERETAQAGVSINKNLLSAASDSTEDQEAARKLMIKNQPDQEDEIRSADGKGLLEGLQSKMQEQLTGIRTTYSTAMDNVAGVYQGNIHSELAEEGMEAAVILNQAASTLSEGNVLGYTAGDLACMPQLNSSGEIVLVPGQALLGLESILANDSVEQGAVHIIAQNQAEAKMVNAMLAELAAAGKGVFQQKIIITTGNESDIDLGEGQQLSVLYVDEARIENNIDNVYYLQVTQSLAENPGLNGLNLALAAIARQSNIAGLTELGENAFQVSGDDFVVSGEAGDKLRMDFLEAVRAFTKA